jgi:hypothetical protein
MRHSPRWCRCGVQPVSRIAPRYRNPFSDLGKAELMPRPLHVVSAVAQSVRVRHNLSELADVRLGSHIYGISPIGRRRRLSCAGV